MKVVNKPQTVVAMGRPTSITKEFQPLPMQSPDRQVTYNTKSQSQAKIQTYVTSPYMQSPNYETRQTYTTPNVLPSQSPKKLVDSYQYKVRGDSRQILQSENQKPMEVLKSENFNRSNDNTYRYDYNKTFQGAFQTEILKDANSERRSNTTKKDAPYHDQKENMNRSPITEQTKSGSQYGILQPKSKLSWEISRISGTLRELLSAVQRAMGGNLSDSLNDKMIEILSNFRKLEDQISDQNPDTDSRVAVMTEDYNKLKGIMEQMQSKMTALVQENQKLNKSLIEQESKVGDEQRKRLNAEDKQSASNKEFNRVFECLQINQRENEELRQRIQSLEGQQHKDTTVCRQLFQQDEQNKDIIRKYQQLQKEFEQLEYKYSNQQQQLQQQQQLYQTQQQAKSQELVGKSPSLAKSFTSKSEQLELKVLQMQIENDNLKSELAHLQVDYKAMDNKTEMINKLEDKIRSIMREKSQFEEQQNQVCSNYEILIEQLKQTQRDKDQDIQNVNRSKNDLEKEFKSSISNYQTIQRSLEEKLNISKQDYQKLVEDYKQLDLKKVKFTDELRQADKLNEQQHQEISHCKGEIKKLQDRNSGSQHQIEQMTQQLQQQSQLQQSLMQQIEGYKHQEAQIRSEFERAENQWKLYRQEMKNQNTDLNEQIGLHIRRYQEKEKQLMDVIEEMSAIKDQYEVQKKVGQENSLELERRLKNLKLQHEDVLVVKENEINDLKMAMEQQIKILEKRTSLASYDYEQREQQLLNELQSKEDQFETMKSDLEKLRSTNFNLQEELLRAGMLLTQHQSGQQGLKNELLQSKQEQQHLLEMLKKRKEETEILHQNLEEARKEQFSKKSNMDDGRRSMMRHQDMQITMENIQRENLQLQQRINTLQNELNRKQREVVDKSEEMAIIKRKYDETVIHLDRLEKKWGDKIEQHKKN